jgi:hypothetical protein
MRRGEVFTGIRWEDLKKRDHWADPGIVGRIIFFRKWDVCKDWIELAQDRDRWRALVNAVKNLRVA